MAFALMTLMLLKIEVSKSVSMTLPVLDADETRCRVCVERKPAKVLMAGQHAVLFKPGTGQPDVVREGIIREIRNTKGILSIQLI